MLPAAKANPNASHQLPVRNTAPHGCSDRGEATNAAITSATMAAIYSGPLARPAPAASAAASKLGADWLRCQRQTPTAVSAASGKARPMPLALRAIAVKLGESASTALAASAPMLPSSLRSNSGRNTSAIPASAGASRASISVAWPPTQKSSICSENSSALFGTAVAGTGSPRACSHAHIASRAALPASGAAPSSKSRVAVA